MKKLSVIFLSLTLLINPSISHAHDGTHADCAQECREIIKSADEYIAELQRANEQMGALNQYIIDENESLQTTVDMLESEKNTWWKNPWLAGALGIIIGGAGAIAIQ